MAKDFAALYTGTNDSSALEQKFFIKEEVTRGTLIAPTGTDFIKTVDGGSVNYTQPKESSPHRSGRHNTSIIKKKIQTEWTIPTLVNIDTTVGAGITEVDLGMRTLWKSTLGKETIPGGVVYDSSTAPNTSFSIFENGDVWAKQAFGGFVESCTMNFPGDGESNMEFAGFAKNAYNVGLGLTQTDNDAGNTITLQAGEAERFPVGSMIMMVEADGTTRSADTPDGSPRIVTARDLGTDVLTVDGAVLADADGASADIYVSYYEPETPTAIDDIQTGLVGSIAIDNLASADCIRNATITLTNNHTLYDNCYGEEGLGGPLFAAGGRLDVAVEIEPLLNKAFMTYLDGKKSFIPDDVDLILGDSAGRHLKVDLPKVIYDFPAIEVPADGVIPVSMSGMGFQTALDVGDEITVSYL